MFRFDAFDFDVATRRLRRGGENIHLSPKAFDLLAVLVEAAPRVVSKRELHARLWPGGVVADATLVALVKHLRQALGDRDRRAPLIRTVHRVGYALEAGTARGEGVAPPARERWLMLGQRRLVLPSGDNLVGRDAAAQVRLDDPAVSRQHARILISDSGTRIEDLGSKNGTFLDGVRLSAGAVPLPDGSRVGFGTLVVTFHEPGSDMPTLTHFGER
jgi:DNA-binding winged helix-turn-helix (wHTH) protein